MSNQQVWLMLRFNLPLGNKLKQRNPDFQQATDNVNMLLRLRCVFIRLKWQRRNPRSTKWIISLNDMCFARRMQRIETAIQFVSFTKPLCRVWYVHLNEITVARKRSYSHFNNGTINNIDALIYTEECQSPCYPFSNDFMMKFLRPVRRDQDKLAAE
jgi:hypothetical protein